MKKLIAIAAALSATTAVHAAQKSTQAPAVAVQKRAVAPSKNRIARKTLKSRTMKVAANTPAPTATVAAISENTSQQRTSVQQDIQSSQSSATRLSMPTSASTVEANKVAPRMIPLDNFKMGANLYYYGSSIASPLDEKVPDFYHGYEENNDQDRVSAEVHFMAGYKFHPNYTVSINPQFSVAPSNASTGAGNTFMEPIASYLKLGVGQFAQVGNMKWNGDFRYYPGITEDLRHAKVQIAHIYRTGQNLTFTLSKSTNFAIYNTIRYQQRHSQWLAKNPDAFQWRATVSPTIEHQVNDKVGLSASYNWDNRKPDNVGFLDFKNYRHEGDGPYLELGASLDLIKNLNLNPYIDAYTRRPNFYGTRWGMNVGWTIL